MEYRTFGRTGLRVSAMGIGGGPFRGGEIDVETIREIITEGVAAGINFIETAEDYNEAKLGAGLEGIDRSKVILSTKNTECGERRWPNGSARAWRICGSTGSTSTACTR